MKLKLVSAALITLAMTGVSAVAVAEPAKLNGCKGCHTTGMGPSFADIAATGRDKATLVNSILNGTGKGTGVYVGKSKMPSMPKNRVSEEEASALADYILAQK